MAPATGGAHCTGEGCGHDTERMPSAHARPAAPVRGRRLASGRRAAVPARGSSGRRQAAGGSQT